MPVSAPFRGTQLVYALEEREDAAPAVCPLSVGSAIAKGLIFSAISTGIHGFAHRVKSSYHHASFSVLMKQV